MGSFLGVRHPRDRRTGTAALAEDRPPLRTTVFRRCWQQRFRTLDPPISTLPAASYAFSSRWPGMHAGHPARVSPGKKRAVAMGSASKPRKLGQTVRERQARSTAGRTVMHEESVVSAGIRAAVVRRWNRSKGLGPSRAPFPQRALREVSLPAWPYRTASATERLRFPKFRDAPPGGPCSPTYRES